MAVDQVRRARLTLLLDEGASRGTAMNELRCDLRFVTPSQTRFASERMASPYGRYPGSAPRLDQARLEARVLDYTLRRKPADVSTHWCSRKLAAQLGMPSMMLQRIWRKHEVRPHRLNTHMVPNDPDFEAKATDVIGLYLNPPLHAALFCVDKKTAIQAFDRKGHTNVSIHYSPTYLSWSNQVENWIARIQPDIITRGVFTTTRDLDNSSCVSSANGASRLPR